MVVCDRWATDADRPNLRFRGGEWSRKSGGSGWHARQRGAREWRARGGAWGHGAEREDRMRRILYENGLSLAMVGLFVLCVMGQSVAGHGKYNADRQGHG